MMMQQTTTLWDSSPVIDEEEEEEQDLDGFDPWGEPLWASRSDTRGGTAGCDSRPMLARGPAGSR